MRLTDTQLSAVFEFLRVLALGTIAYMLTEGLNLIATLIGDQLPLETRYLIIGLATTVLKAVDKYLHKTGQEYEEATGELHPYTTGITRF